MAMEGSKSHGSGSTNRTGGGSGHADKNHKKSHKKKKKHKKPTKEKGHHPTINSSSPEDEGTDRSVKARGENGPDRPNHQSHTSITYARPFRPFCAKPSPLSKHKLGPHVAKVTSGRASAPIQNQSIGQVRDKIKDENKGQRASSVGAVCKSSSNISVSSGESASHTSLPKISSKTCLTVSHEDLVHKSTLRWDAQLEDPSAEAERIRMYKINRRKRYLAAQNKKYSDWMTSWNNEFGESSIDDTVTIHGVTESEAFQNGDITMDTPSDDSQIESTISIGGVFIDCS